MSRLAAVLLSLITAAVLVDAPLAEDGRQAGASPAADALDAELSAAAAQLSSPEFRLRQRAFERLFQAGVDGLAALEQAARSSDREARSRALTILVALAGSPREELAGAAQKTLRGLESAASGPVARDASGAAAEARVARMDRAIDAIQTGGGTVTTPEGEEPVIGADLAIQIGAAWKRGSADLKALADLPDVTWLSLEDSPIDDAGLAHVGQLANLQSLFLKGTRVRGPGLEHLAGLHKLSHLSLRELPLDDAALARLPEFPQLTNLGLDNTAITDAGLAELKRFPLLETLWLDKTKITDAGLRELATLTQLRTLYLTGTRTGGPGMAGLRELSSLRYLSLREVSLLPETARTLAELSQLETLGLDHTNITDGQLAEVARLKNLRTLFLSGTAVTDAGIEHLKTLESLEMLLLDGTRVTAAGRQALRAALPRCVVEPPEQERASSNGR